MKNHKQGKFQDVVEDGWSADTEEAGGSLEEGLRPIISTLQVSFTSNHPPLSLLLPILMNPICNIHNINTHSRLHLLWPCSPQPPSTQPLLPCLVPKCKQWFMNCTGLTHHQCSAHPLYVNSQPEPHLQDASANGTPSVS